MLVMGTKFGLNSNTTHAQRITQVVQSSGSAMRDPCYGLGSRCEHTVYRRQARVRYYESVHEYRCNCYQQIGGQTAFFENVRVLVTCFPRYASGNSMIARATLSVMMVCDTFDPPRAPASQSPPSCGFCENSGPDGDGLDPDGDEDGDGIPNGQDDTPYGYTGDDPDGDADGDGIPNRLDPTPYGYDGNDPWGDDDGDGIPNCQDPTPYGEHFIWFTPIFGVPGFAIPSLWLS